MERPIIRDDQGFLVACNCSGLCVNFRNGTYRMHIRLRFVFLNFPFVCQNISACQKLNRPWLAIVYCYNNNKSSAGYSFSYRISPPISPGLIRVRKAFLMGLSTGGLISGGTYMRVKNNGKRDDSSDKHSKTE